MNTGNDKNKRYVHRYAYWQGMIDKCKASGLKPAEFCREEKISHSSFSHWCNRLSKQTDQISKPLFVPIKVKEEKNIKNDSHAGLVLLLRNGHQACISSQTDKAALKILFEVLGILPC